MEGASSGLAGHLDDKLPEQAQFVLAWNPPQLHTEQESTTQPPPDTALSALQSNTLGSSRQAAFYDKHLAPGLVLERVVYFDTLVSTLANTVDQAIQDAVAERPLPKDALSLPSEQIIKRRDRALPLTKYHELGVAESYLSHASQFCRPIASTLALHPSSEHWDSILDWTLDGKLGRWAIADGVLRISRNDKWRQEMLQNEGHGKKGILNQLADRATALAVWEMKSLTVGTAPVMEEIIKWGQTHAKFPWKKCALTVCNHRFWEVMKESMESYDAGFDPRSPPWTLPIVPSTSSADSRPTGRRKSLRSASAQSGTTSFSYKERSMSPVEDGEGEGKKRRHSDSDAEEFKRPPKKSRKSKAELMDESYEPPPGARQEVNAQSFIQQVPQWFLIQMPILTTLYLHLDMGRGGAQQLHYNDSAFRKS
jgi:hypothetical protein